MNKYNIKYYLKPATRIEIITESEDEIEDMQEKYNNVIKNFKTIIEPVQDKKTTIIKTSEIICVDIEKIQSEVKDE